MQCWARNIPFQGLWTFKEVDSACTPFVQLADLFAGMATYTRMSRKFMRTLLAENEDQRDLFPTALATESGPTAKDRGRFQVVSHLYRRSKEAELGVSLKEHGYLRTLESPESCQFLALRATAPEGQGPHEGPGLNPSAETDSHWHLPQARSMNAFTESEV